MEQYIIKGGHPLVGEVEIGGAKNAALAILAAAIMTDETVLVDNLPDVNDINVLLDAISGIGANVHRVDRHTVKINGKGINDVNIEYDYIKKIRASYYLLGALLGKYKRAEVALPGGCNIGSRPIDQHIKGFRALGADVDIEYGKIMAEADRLVGKHIYFDVVSVGATINVMMAATMAEGLTIMENVAKEPHVVDVANFLNSMGANIRGAGTDVIKIRGVQRLHSTEYSVIPDQIEPGHSCSRQRQQKGDVTVLNVIPKHLEATIAKLVEIGCEVEEFDDAVRVVSKGDLTSTHVKTLPYPGFPTDMQPQIGVTLALCQGTSTITESIFENRFKYLDELARMGANVKIEGNSATIEGVKKFTGTRVSAPDLRAGARSALQALPQMESRSWMISYISREDMKDLKISLGVSEESSRRWRRRRYPEVQIESELVRQDGVEKFHPSFILRHFIPGERRGARMKKGKNRYAVLAIASIVNFVHGNPYIWTVFQPYVRKEYGLSLAASSQPFTIIIGIFALGNMLGGYLQHKIGAKKTILAGSLVMCLGFFLAAVAPSHMPWLISLGYGALGAWDRLCVQHAGGGAPGLVSGQAWAGHGNYSRSHRNLRRADESIVRFHPCVIWVPDCHAAGDGSLCGSLPGRLLYRGSPGRAGKPGQRAGEDGWEHKAGSRHKA